MTAQMKTINGRVFYVVPITALVPGVLPGSNGPLYYPPDEVRNSVQEWNGMPLTLSHTTRNGIHVSARNPDVFNQHLGAIYNARIDRRGALVVDGYFDAELTERADRRVYAAVLAGKTIEVSTGLFTDNEPAPAGATYNGRSYTHIARKYRPDHLAVLPDETGACSRRDGCGVGVLNGRRVHSPEWDFAAALENLMKNCPSGTIQPTCVNNSLEPLLPPGVNPDQHANGSQVQALLDRLAAQLPPRGSLLPSHHTPTLEQRLADLGMAMEDAGDDLPLPSVDFTNEPNEEATGEDVLRPNQPIDWKDWQNQTK